VSQKIIAFYSPLKPVGHQTPSGDRLMARLLIRCLEQSAYQVDIASGLRSFLRNPDSESDKATLMEQAEREVERLTLLWKQQGAPHAWFCYHAYYKSPDLIGPPMCSRFDIPYLTAEVSYSERRGHGVWAQVQEAVLATVNQAAVNICFTERDRIGLLKAAPDAVRARLRPFIDTSAFQSRTTTRHASRLITVAMMREGDKLQSYTRLAAALKKLLHLPWTLSVIGDGRSKADVHRLFSDIPPERLVWHGQLGQSEIAASLAVSTLYVWPGCGEAYGLAYLEAQAAGLPVVAYATAGVPEVVDHGNTGILTPEGDDQAYAAAIAHLLHNDQQRQHMSDNAAAHVQRYHSLQPASVTLNSILQHYVGVQT